MHGILHIQFIDHEILSRTTVKNKDALTPNTNESKLCSKFRLNFHQIYNCTCTTIQGMLRKKENDNPYLLSSTISFIDETSLYYNASRGMAFDILKTTNETTQSIYRQMSKSLNQRKS